MDVNHPMLNKFRGPTDANYISVANWIYNFAAEARAQEQSNEMRTYSNGGAQAVSIDQRKGKGKDYGLDSHQETSTRDFQAPSDYYEAQSGSEAVRSG
jgi:hypothetical protein